MAFRLGSALRTWLGGFARDRRGAAAMFLALGLVPLVGAVGLAVDSSLGYLLRARMTKSLDAAGLAAGRIALDANAATVARQYFDANFGAGGAATITDFKFELDATQHFVTLSAHATTPTYFMRVFGHDEMNVGARTVVERQTNGMELALVMDNTGSMWGKNFNAMQAAALDLVKIIYGDKTEIDNVWISLTPFVATVNVGSTRTSWLAAGDRVLTDLASYDTAGWKGCVMAQAYPYDTDDTPIASQKLTSFFYAKTPGRTADNDWPPIKPKQVNKDKNGNDSVNESRGPNLGCGPAITPLTKSRATIEAGLKGMAAWGRGGTTSNLGLSWGWRTISPRWRGAWGGETPNTLPLNYKTDFMKKIAILLTDGDNQFHDNDTASGDTTASDFTAYGRIETLLGGTSVKFSDRVGKGKGILDARMLETCAAMKAQGIEIYTIIFRDSASAATKTLFEKCATSPAMYYYAPKAEDIAGVFRSIGGQLANLLIVE